MCLFLLQFPTAEKGLATMMQIYFHSDPVKNDLYMTIHFLAYGCSMSYTLKKSRRRGKEKKKIYIYHLSHTVIIITSIIVVRALCSNYVGNPLYFLSSDIPPTPTRWSIICLTQRARLRLGFMVWDKSSVCSLILSSISRWNVIKELKMN